MAPPRRHATILVAAVLAPAAIAGCYEGDFIDETWDNYHVLLHPPELWVDAGELHLILRLSTPHVPGEWDRPTGFYGLDVDLEFDHGRGPVIERFEASDYTTLLLGGAELGDGETVGIHVALDLAGLDFDVLGIRLSYNIVGSPFSGLPIAYHDPCRVFDGLDLVHSDGPKSCRSMLDSSTVDPWYALNAAWADGPPPEQWPRWTYVPAAIQDDHRWFVANMDRQPDRWLDHRISCYSCDDMELRLISGGRGA